MPNDKTPSPQHIDQFAQELMQLETAADDAAAALKAKRDELLPIISNYGRTPDGAAKSRRLDGDRFYLLATYGQSVAVVKKTVEELRGQLREEGRPSLFRRLYMTDVSYIVHPDAALAIGDLSAKVRKLFERSTRTSQLKPKVKAEKKDGGN